MSAWRQVGEWISDNAAPGAALVGSLLTGNVPGAVAAGVSLVQSATGVTDPSAALSRLRSSPETQLELERLAVRERDNIRAHLLSLEELKLQDHQETQRTIRSGDNADSAFVRYTRPGQSWVCLFAALTYVYAGGKDLTILGMLMTYPWAYAGLRQCGKSFDSYKEIKNVKKEKR